MSEEQLKKAQEAEAISQRAGHGQEQERIRVQQQATAREKETAGLRKAVAELKAGQGACCVKGYVDASFMAKSAEMERLVADLGLSNDPSSNL